MTTRPRGASLEQESANFEEGVGDLSVEEKYVEVKQLIALGKEKGFLLYDEIYEVLPEEVTSLPEELDEIYIRFNDLGIDVVEDAEKQLAPPTGKGTMTIDGTIEEKIDLAMPEDEDEIDMAALSAGALTKIADIMVIFDKVARFDKRMKDTKAKLNEKKLSQRALANI